MPSEVIELDSDLVEYITSQLKPEDVSPNMLSLVRIAIIAHEHAFHFQGNSSKNTFLDYAGVAWDEVTEIRPSPVEPEEQWVLITHNKFLLNLENADAAIKYHAINFPLVTKEVLLHYVGEAWDAGERQRKVQNCDIEGSINNEYGVALNFACGIALFGKSKGLLPEEYKSTAKGNEGTQDGSKPETSPETSPAAVQ